MTAQAHGLSSSPGHVGHQDGALPDGGAGGWAHQRGLACLFMDGSQSVKRQCF